MNSDHQSEVSSWSNPKNELAVIEWTHWNNPVESDVEDDISIKFSSLNIVATPPSIAVLLSQVFMCCSQIGDVLKGIKLQQCKFGLGFVIWPATFSPGLIVKVQIDFRFIHLRNRENQQIIFFQAA